MEKGEIINLIKGRIEDEQRKHPLLNWPRIAAIKIYTEWFEYFDNENQELKEDMADKKYTEEDLRQAMIIALVSDSVKGSKDIDDYIKSLNKQDLPIINGSYGCTIETSKNKQD